MRCSIFLVIFILLVGQQVTQASEAPDVSAADVNLVYSSYWLALGHYRHQIFYKKNYYSFIEDKNFFLSDQGDSDPLAELIATIEAVDQTETEYPDSHPVCRFPARYDWLNTQLKNPQFTSAYQKHAAHCVAYRQWRKDMQAYSAALIYASSHLNSPSSMYGHTLLRIDPPDMNQKGTPLLSWGVNFAAQIPPEDNSLAYSFNGIFGGYPGFFSVMPYYEKLKEYSRMENRDVWEYTLNLNETEMDRLMMHLWELDKVRFRYFFFDENCSYRLLELLDVARPNSDVLKGYQYAVIPLDTVKGMIQSGFVTGTNFRPSVSTSLSEKFSQLSADEQRLAIDLSNSVDYLRADAYKALSGESRARVSQVAYDALRYRVRQSPREEAVVKHSYQLLTEINQLPVISFPDSPLPSQPEMGHDSGAFTVTTGREAGQNYADIELRLSFHDLLDNSQGYIEGSAINMGKFKFRAKESEGVQLQQFDVIDISSLSPRDHFFKPISWRTSVGFERQAMYSGDEGVWQANGGMGVSYRLADQTLFYTLATGRAEYNEGFADNWQVAAGATTGVLHVSAVGSTLFSVDGYEFVNDYQRRQLSLSQNITLQKDASLRLMATRHFNSDMNFNTLEISFREFF